MRRLISLSLGLLFLSSLTACGSSGGGNAGTQRTEAPGLAEVAANLPRPDVPLVVNNSGNTGEAGSASANDSNPLIDTDPNSSGGVDPNDFIVVEQTAGPSSSSASAVLRRFLWKPDSESDGNLVVLVDLPNIRVEVFGSISESLRNTGPSNGRGTTARGSRPGCSYGTGIAVQFFNSGGRRLAFVDGRTTVAIPDGCQRVEFDL